MLIVAGTALIFAVGFLFGRLLSQQEDVHVLVNGSEVGTTMPAVDGTWSWQLTSDLPTEQSAVITATVLDQGRPIAQKQLEFPISKLGQIGNFNYFAGEIKLPPELNK